MRETGQKPMPPRRPQNEGPQAETFKIELVNLVNPAHPMVKLTRVIDWPNFNKAFTPQYQPSTGRPGLPTRLMVGCTI
jgi:IS5 family transposase